MVLGSAEIGEGGEAHGIARRVELGKDGHEQLPFLLGDVAAAMLRIEDLLIFPARGFVDLLRPNGRRQGSQEQAKAQSLHVRYTSP
jgi:hypothetical protein